ncbi:hypothetical protein FOA52_000331 [Chlamydomonas sp. UWO 241]|nr:hypothetical protein FOA52_000331 [Chlamydomonas sp. UWO 241]
MVNKSMMRALWTVRAAVRMKMLAQRCAKELHIPEGEVEDELCARPYNREAYERVSHGALGTSPAQRNSSPGDAGAAGVSRLSDPLLERESQLIMHPSDEPAPLSLWHELALLRNLLSNSYFSILLLTVPVAFVAGAYSWHPVIVFTTNFIALIPLALLLGDVTEDLAARFGDVIGGLLNATFGNVVEVVLAVQALRKGLYTVVAMSLIGSILSNLLLVLGCSMLIGGIFHHQQFFNTESTQAQSVLLFLAVVGVAVPTSAQWVIKDHDKPKDFILDISRVSAIVLLFCYIGYLFFQLVTHPEVESGDDDEQEEVDEERSIAKSAIEVVGRERTGSTDGTALLSLPTAISVLTVISVLVAIHCDYLTAVIETFCDHTGLGQSFVGMIILPIAGNACEHMAAVVMAARNKMNLSLGIAIGSGLQISMFAIPFTVLVGWAIDRPFSLDVDMFALLTLMFSVMHANLVIVSGSSNWLTGLTLVAIYVLVAATYFFR